MKGFFFFASILYYFKGLGWTDSTETGRSMLHNEDLYFCLSLSTYLRVLRARVNNVGLFNFWVHCLKCKQYPEMKIHPPLEKKG